MVPERRGKWRGKIASTKGPFEVPWNLSVYVFANKFAFYAVSISLKRGFPSQLDGFDPRSPLH